MNRQQLVEIIREKKSYLCTGLDTEIARLPKHFSHSGESLLEFNKAVVGATVAQSVAYKINTAFYEQYGAAGWQWMEETLKAIPKTCFRIADAKRGDIGNTSTMYARAFFETMDFDAITVAPYMGEDSLRPFLEFKDKWIICLALTSNPGHKDFQKLEYQQKQLYQTVIETVCKWGNEHNLMFVVGATRAEDIAHVRSIIPDHFLLVPGVGAQGGNLAEVSQAGINKDCGLLVNASRSILYASDGEDFADAARLEAMNLQNQMEVFI